jgi:hypothetical protein
VAEEKKTPTEMYKMTFKAPLLSSKRVSPKEDGTVLRKTLHFALKQVAAGG